MSTLEQFPANLPPPTAPDTQEILEKLQKASSKKDVAAIIRRYHDTAVNNAWQSLHPADRSALLLMRAFDGEIIHDYIDTP